MNDRYRGSLDRGRLVAFAARAACLLSGPLVACQAAAIGVLDEPASCGGAPCSGVGGSGAADAGTSVGAAPGTLVAGSTGTSVALDGGVQSPSVRLVPCGPLTRPLVDDFELARMSWYLIDDGLGTRSFADGVVLVPGGPGSSLFAAHTAGDGFTNWGAFAEMPVPSDLGECAYDVRAFAGLRFAAQAGGHGTFRVELPGLLNLQREYGGACVEGCGDFHGVDLAAPPGTWVECSIRFDDLDQEGYATRRPLDLESIHSVRLHFTDADQPFDLRFDNVEFATDITATRCVRLPDTSPPASDAGSVDAG